MSPEERFRKRFTKGKPSECWLWRGAKNAGGYGAFFNGERTETASRTAYRFAYGPIAPGMVIRHKCDNRPCVNPAHLELGTHHQNSRDMVERGRAARRCNSGHANTPENRFVDAKGKVRCRPCAFRIIDAQVEKLNDRLWRLLRARGAIEQSPPHHRPRITSG